MSAGPTIVCRSPVGENYGRFPAPAGLMKCSAVFEQDFGNTYFSCANVFNGLPVPFLCQAGAAGLIRGFC